MKRPITNFMPDPPAPPRRKRLLSEEERRLWESVAGQTKPLRKKPRIPKPSPTSAHPEPAAESAAPPKQLPPAKRTRQPGLEPSSPPLVPIGRRERGQLSRGRKEIDARLDLHGMTQTRAHRALSDFLQRAHSGGLTFVLVITGKGGVLRGRLPLWLGQPELQPLVAGVNEAHVKHGGSGAFYVLLRKHSRPR